MEDSFFGFDTSISYDEDANGGQIEEPSEEEYDALNDETFGSAVNTDWEEAHESMVRLEDNPGVVNDFVGDSGRRLASNNALHNSRHFAFDDRDRLSSNASSRVSTPAILGRVRHKADSDLELNLVNMKLEEVDIRFNENLHSGFDMSGISLDPNVWSTNPLQALKNVNTSGNNNVLFNNYSNGLSSNVRTLLDDPFATKPMQQQLQQQPQLPYGLPKLPNTSNICTLEDIERNIILGQTMQKQQQQQQQFFKPPTPIQQQLLQQKNTEQNKSLPQAKGTSHSPPRLPNNVMNIPQQQQQQQAHALLQHQQQQQQHQQQHLTSGARLPPGFPPIYPPGFGPQLPPGQTGNHGQLPIRHPLLNQHNLPMNFQHPLQRPQLPIALNNFAMHPTFSPMRAAAAANMNLLGAPTPPIGITNNQQQLNMLNMRMMQEIQQNHPMLQQQRALMPQMQQHQQNNQHHLHHQLQHHHELQRNNNMKQQHHRQQNRINGNFPKREYDEYANLMSTRDKHWLIGIQLSQLNVDTPYIDDFYYTVYKERQAALKGEMRNSQTHKDNQLNHPLTQPRGHAQLIMVQLGNKNGTRNGQQRERRNSDANANMQNNSHNNNNNNQNHNNSQDKLYVFTPLKFENSLGKLQYGSVTAPRKIIDAEIMGSEAAQMPNGSTPVRPKTPAVTWLGAANYMLAGGVGGVSSGSLALMQHKTRDLLLHIETLFRIVLKLEDLKNPLALQSIMLKKKKEAERLAAMEQQENANKTAEEISAAATTTASEDIVQTKPKFFYEIEPEEELLETLMSGLTIDKVIAIMNVRKGKILLRRVLPFITDNNMRWNVWIAIFQALQTVVKKDREDNEGTLYALYPEFKKQIQLADLKTLMRFAHAMSLNDKKSDSIFCSRFGISALVCLITRAEQIYQQGNANDTLDDNHKKEWPEFLNQMATSLNRTIQNQTICAAIESDSIQPLMNHVKRFNDLKLDALLALIAKAKKQIN